MNIKKPTEQMYQSLQMAYDHFNKELFEGKLPDVLIVLQRQPKTMGYVSRDRWQNGEGGCTDELAVNPEYFMGFPLMEVCQTLVHEQVHVFQHHFGKPGRRGYHNRQWADMMNDVGLVPSHTGRPGGRQTGERMGDYVLIDGPFYHAAGKLLQKGFALPWIDRRPVPASNYIHAVYTADNAVAQIVPDASSLPLYIPLGSTIHQMGDVEEEAQPAPVPQLHVVETTGTGGSEGDEVASAEAPAVAAQSAVPTSASITLMSNVRLTAPVVPVRAAARNQPTRAKYTCECGNNVWGKANLAITCNTCQKAFEEQ